MKNLIFYLFKTGLLTQVWEEIGKCTHNKCKPNPPYGVTGGEGAPTGLALGRRLNAGGSPP